MTQFRLNSWMIEDLECRVRQLEQRAYGGKKSGKEETCETGARAYDVRRVSVQALRYTSHNWKVIEEFFGDVPWYREMTPTRVPSGRLCIAEAGKIDGVFVSLGDWLVKDAQGDIFPLDHDLFTRLYQERYAA